MDSWIGRLHNRYQIYGGRTVSVGTAARLDRLARERLPEVWSAVLDEVLGDDPMVYVIRKVETRVGLNLATAATDRALALSWGARLTRSVIQSIAEGEETGNLVRFPDQADYVAHFAIDLVLGRAWSCWYYMPFARLEGLPVADALAAVLGEHPPILARVLARLHGLGRLGSVLEALPEISLRSLWAGVSGGGANDPAALRPLLSAALGLADRLGLWIAATPEREALFRLYTTSAPLPADWRDSRALASAVADAFAFLVDRGLVRRPNPGEDGLDEALAMLDWLDPGWLRAGLFDAPSASVAPPADLPVRPVSLGQGPTPRQRALLDDLAAVLAGAGLDLLRNPAGRAGDALRLHAALVERASRWEGDPAVAAVIEGLLAAATALRRSRTPDEALRSLARGDVTRALLTLAEPERLAGAPAFRLVAGLGEPAVALVRSLAGRAPGGGAGEPTSVFETRCAGVFLLIRTVLDARLAALARQSGFPLIAEEQERFRALLAALGSRWAGAAWHADGRLDPGLALFAGLDPAITPDVFASLFDATPADACARFQNALLRALSGLRLVGGSTIQVELVETPGRLALVGGDASGRARPLGRVVSGLDDVPRVVALWQDVWAAATGESVAAIVCAAELVEVLDHCGLPVQTLAAPATRVSVRAALAALDHARAGVPETDLTLDLAAAVLLHAWAAWLRRFAGSSVPYLLENFVRRAGRVVVREGQVEVWLEPAPLDVVLEMSGYLAELENVPWLGCRVTFRLRRP